MPKNKQKPTAERPITANPNHNYERWLAFGRNGETQDTWLWCLHCERAYQIRDIRIIKHPVLSGETLEMCAYPDCDGDSVLDGQNWPPRGGLPSVPTRDTVYPLYGTDEQ